MENLEVKPKSLLEQLEYNRKMKEDNPIRDCYDHPQKENLKRVPKSSQTDELIRYVCSNDGLALMYVSKKRITKEICEIAVRENGIALEYVPIQFVSYELCFLAVKSNGLAIKYVPDNLKSLEMSEVAVSYYWDKVLKEYRETEEEFKLRKLKSIEDANSSGGKLRFSSHYPIYYVPDIMKSEDLYRKSILYSPFSLCDISDKDRTKSLIELALSLDGCSLRYIQFKQQTREIVGIALENTPLALQFVAPKYISQDICDELFIKDYQCFYYIPEKFITVDMVLHLIEIKRFAVFPLSKKYLFEVLGDADIEMITFSSLPEKMRNDKVVLDAIVKLYKGNALVLREWNEYITEKRRDAEQNKWSRSMPQNRQGKEIFPLSKEILEYIAPQIIESVEKTSCELIVPKDGIDNYIKKKDSFCVPLEPAEKDSIYVAKDSNSVILHEFANENSAETIYYISDIHIEHQLFEEIDNYYKLQTEKKLENINALLTRLLNEKIDEMVECKKGILLIGGDVADSVELSKLFYELLSTKWDGIVVSILGNHELWDGKSSKQWVDSKYKVRNLDEIINDYREMIGQFNNNFLLENELLIKYKNESIEIIKESDILLTSSEELKEILAKSTLIILGGLGYTGFNEYYNSERGLYGKTLESLEEDKRRTLRFNAIYNKIKMCASDRTVIVLSHTPVNDWTKEECVANWIYVNGHTHQNSITKKKNGMTILADNQIGYKAQKWKLNAFTFDTLWYDPFEMLENGIHKINSEQYKSFNKGRGILCNGCNYEGELFVLKRDELYMFVLQTAQSLCLMSGGSRKKLDNYDIHYYYNNLSLYGQCIRSAVAPYQNVLRKLSKEVQSFGGLGTIHGCIVDITWFSHIYVNPFDGKMTCYWAPNVTSREVYSNIKKLLKVKEPDLYNHYMVTKKERVFPIIKSQLSINSKGTALAVVPQWVIGTEMYGPSRLVKSFQYAWEKNVIRIWNDSILDNNKLEKEDFDKLVEIRG